MKSRLIRSLLLCFPLVAAAQTSTVDMAAARFHPHVEWHSRSVLSGDFSCQGRVEQAIAGIAQNEIVVAVFTGGLESSPQLLRFATTSRERARLELVAENMNFDTGKMIQMLGDIPSGMRPSATCKGIHLINGKTDSLHIYWNHDKRLFDYWLF